MNKTKAILLTGVLLASFGAHANDTSLSKSFCNAAQDELSSVNEQLPISIDYMTQLIGASALHTKGNDLCNVTMTYLIESNKFIGTFSDATEGAMNFNESTDFLNSSEGNEILTNVFKQQGEQEYKDYNLEGVEIRLLYKSDDSKLNDLSVTLFE